MRRSQPAAVAKPVSTKDPVEMASPAKCSANVHETLPGPQATKDPKVTTAMKSVTPTENPGAKQSTGQASYEVISSSSEFSTVKIPTESPKNDRESSRNASKVISSSPEFSIVKTPTGSCTKDRESPTNSSKVIRSSSELSTVETPTGSPKKDRESARIPSKVIRSSSEFSIVKTPIWSPKQDRGSPTNSPVPGLVSKHLKEASKKAGRSEIQEAVFKPEAAAVNGDGTENSPRVDQPSETTAGPEVINKKKPTLLSHQQLVRFVPHHSTHRPVCNKTEQELETALRSPNNEKTPRLQVKVTSYPERKRIADAGQQEQNQFKREKNSFTFSLPRGSF